MNNRNILISGAGIAGPTLAFWLKRYGFNPTVVEQAPQPREGGYTIDFRGVGIDVAERMGVMPRVRDAQYVPNEMVFVDESNKVLAKVDIGRLFQETFDDPRRAQTTIMRSDLARILYEATRGEVEYIFDDSIRGMKEDPQGVDVAFESWKSRRFDLVVGADGLHSNVRALTFGEEPQLSEHLGYHQAAFMVEYPTAPGRYLIYTEPGKIVLLIGFPANRALAVAIFRQPKKLTYDPRDTEMQKRLFAAAFASVTWDSMPALLEQAHASRDFFFDAATAIRVDRWSKGRVALVGDAGYPTGLTAWGVSMALAGAYVLAGELKAAAGDHRTAFAAYEREFRPFVERKTRKARGTGLLSLVPGSAMGLWLRNQVLKVFSRPGVSRLFTRMTYGRMFRDSFTLRDYEGDTKP